MYTIYPNQMHDWNVKDSESFSFTLRMFCINFNKQTTSQIKVNKVYF